MDKNYVALIPTVQSRAAGPTRTHLDKQVAKLLLFPTTTDEVLHVDPRGLDIVAKGTTVTVRVGRVQAPIDFFLIDASPAALSSQ
jgi:hypothetical protein